MSDPSQSNVLIILSQSRFKDEELKTLQALLVRRKVPMKIAVPVKKEVFGMANTRVKPDLGFDEVSVSDYDAVVFIGGMGVRELWDNPQAHAIARETFESGRILAAISTAPVVLARAGLLEGREATVYFSETKLIAEKGATYTGAAVAVSDNIVTVKGPEAVEKFGLGLLKMLSERSPA
ncbi:MAG: DJ-1 family protein [Proteobacteria bacterium]|nr:DJ-1 family protein [Pseudomonadota bacterium]